MITLDVLRYLAKIGADMKTGEVADVLGITPAEVRRLAMLSDGLYPLRTGTRTWLYSAREVRSWLAAHPNYRSGDPS